jgi:hypothetical protein
MDTILITRSAGSSFRSSWFSAWRAMILRCAPVPPVSARSYWEFTSFTVFANASGPSQRRRKCKSTINVRVRFTRMTLPVSVAASSNEVVEAKPSPITQTVVPSWKNPAGSFFYSHARVMVCLRTSRSYALSWLFVIAEANASKFPKCLSWLNPRLYLDCSNACTHLRSPV